MVHAGLVALPSLLSDEVIIIGQSLPWSFILLSYCAARGLSGSGLKIALTITEGSQQCSGHAATFGELKFDLRAQQLYGVGQLAVRRPASCMLISVWLTVAQEAGGLLCSLTLHQPPVAESCGSDEAGPGAARRVGGSHHWKTAHPAVVALH